MEDPEAPAPRSQQPGERLDSFINSLTNIGFGKIVLPGSVLRRPEQRGCSGARMHDGTHNAQQDAGVQGERVR
jgi:hypothetical protein